MPLPYRYNLSKMANLKDLEYYGHINAACSIAKEYCEKKPDNNKLKLLSDSLIGIFFWGHAQEQDRRLYNKELSDMRLEKNRAITRARKAEAKANELEKEIKKLKQIINL